MESEKQILLFSPAAYIVYFQAKDTDLFGFEWPMAKNDVHCQSYLGENIGNKPVETINCKALFGDSGDKHCKGSAMIEGISI